MARASSALATKLDIRILKEDIRDEMRAMRGELIGTMRDLQKETIREFKVIAENIRKDAIDSHKDKISLHDDRIKRIETHVGLSHSLSA